MAIRHEIDKINLIYIQFSDPQAGEVQSVSYFVLSGFANLKELPREQEATSPPIYIPDGLLFGTQIATSVYVSLHFACQHAYTFVLKFLLSNNRIMFLCDAG